MDVKIVDNLKTAVIPKNNTLFSPEFDKLTENQSQVNLSNQVKKEIDLQNVNQFVAYERMTRSNKTTSREQQLTIKCSLENRNQQNMGDLVMISEPNPDSNRLMEKKS